jgi:hypothetical protein
LQYWGQIKVVAGPELRAFTFVRLALYHFRRSLDLELLLKID